jgi:hypothetical protein
MKGGGSLTHARAHARARMCVHARAQVWDTYLAAAAAHRPGPDSREHFRLPYHLVLTP